jgi:hypothetical protein
MTNLTAVLNNLNGKLSFVEGHSIAIHEGLQLKKDTGSGKARINPDVTMTSQIRMDVLGMSKTITAAGIVRHSHFRHLSTPSERSFLGNCRDGKSQGAIEQY